MIPTRPKKSRSEVVEPPVEAVRTHVGLQKILEWAGKESGLDEDLKTCFEIGDAQKLSSIARYWVATDGDTLPRMETWQMMNPLPYEYPITQDVYGKLFASVGRNESGVQAYFSKSFLVGLEFGSGHNDLFYIFEESNRSASGIQLGWRRTGYDQASGPVFS